MFMALAAVTACDKGGDTSLAFVIIIRLTGHDIENPAAHLIEAETAARAMLLEIPFEPTDPLFLDFVP